MKQVLVVLQNAWSPLYAGGEWPRRSWLKALQRSRSGKLLDVLASACPEHNFWYDNTTPLVGESPDSLLPADLPHLNRLLIEVNPEVIVACGSYARKALRKVLEGQVSPPLLAIPHPAWRFLTNELYLRAAAVLNAGFEGYQEILR